MCSIYTTNKYKDFTSYVPVFRPVMIFIFNGRRALLLLSFEMNSEYALFNFFDVYLLFKYITKLVQYPGNGPNVNYNNIVGLNPIHIYYTGCQSPFKLSRCNFPSSSTTKNMLWKRIFYLCRTFCKFSRTYEISSFWHGDLQTTTVAPSYLPIQLSVKHHVFSSIW